MDEKMNSEVALTCFLLVLDQYTFVPGNVISRLNIVKYAKII